MCGRYYIDSDMADEIEKVVHDIDQRIRQEHFAGDIFPTNVACFSAAPLHYNSKYYVLLWEISQAEWGRKRRIYRYSSTMTSSCFHIHENKKLGGSTIC